MVALPILLLCSVSAMRKALTMVSVWPFGEPVRGRLDTMRMVPVRLLAATALGDGAATADGDAAAAGLADGLGAADADGLAAADGDAAAADGEAGGLAAGAVVGGAAAGPVVGCAGPPPVHAATKTVAANDSDDSDDRRAS